MGDFENAIVDARIALLLNSNSAKVRNNSGTIFDAADLKDLNII